MLTSGSVGEHQNNQDESTVLTDEFERESSIY